MLEILKALTAARIRCSTESQMHDDVAAALEAGGIPFSRERDLSARDRVDFLSGATAIECKIDGSPTDVARQLIRYAESKEVDGIILVTSRTRLGHHLPNDIDGKPIRVVATWRAAL